MQRSFATLKNERTIGTLAKRIFDIEGATGSEAQKIAEAALLRANPNLAKPDGFKSGRIILVPADTGLKTTDRVTTPRGGVEGALEDTAMRLKLTAQFLEDEMEKDSKETEQTLAQLGDNQFVAKLRKAVPEGTKLVHKTRKSIGERVEANNKVRESYAAALKKATDELERLKALAAKRDT